jgi:hypothetical protein
VTVVDLPHPSDYHRDRGHVPGLHATYRLSLKSVIDGWIEQVMRDEHIGRDLAAACVVEAVGRVAGIQSQRRDPA